MECVIVTGMSGAGKSTALNILEDKGYFCVDNLPLPLIESLIESATLKDKTIEKVAFGIDIRSKVDTKEVEDAIKKLKEKTVDYKILFLDASDECLIKRYKETRRNHPISHGERIECSIAMEREKIQCFRTKANYIIDTTLLLTKELKEKIENIFIHGEIYNNLYITILSFGFKYGIPVDSDLLFDVRFLPNPYYIGELRSLTGNDREVQSFVMNSDISHEFLNKLIDMVQFLIPNYIKEGKNQLVISIGCTGGKHRSVTIANALYKKLLGGEYGLKIEHRDIEKDSQKKGM